MSRFALLNGVVLCLVNILFVFAGTFLNSVAILSIWKSSQLRKKLCYFMIFVLSCMDLVVVNVLHPLIIACYIMWYLENDSVLSHRFSMLMYICNIFLGSSMFGLFTMSLERYLGLTYPLFHKTSVTKKRLAILLVTIQIVAFIYETMCFSFEISAFKNPYIFAFISVSIILIIFMNVKMYFIAKSKHKNITQNGKRRILEYKKYYTCLFAVSWFLISCCPSMVYYGLTLYGVLNFNAETSMPLFFWGSTIVAMNSTINSIIFFWVNNVLRSEGKTLLRGCGLLKSDHGDINN